jgi:hypothetical protein
MNPIPLCSLCAVNPPIKNSHGIPRFAAAWIKRTSATGYLRQAINPNVAKQDIEKYPMLCLDCEGLFSRFEQQFAENIFIPYLDNGQSSFQYEDWLLRFAISLAWRTTLIHLPDCRDNIAPDLTARADTAREYWREFLLQRTIDPGPFTHHLLFLDYLADATVPVPEGIHRYLLRSVDATIVCSSLSLFVYTKLPGMIFWTGVCPAAVPGWSQTQILQRGNIDRKQTVNQPGWGEWLVGRVEQVNGLMSGMSERQAARIEEKLRNDPQRTLASNTYEAVQADNYWANLQAGDDPPSGSG